MQPSIKSGIDDRSRCQHLLIKLNDRTSRWMKSVSYIGYHPKGDNTMQSDKEKKEKTNIQNLSNGREVIHQKTQLSSNARESE